MFSGEILGAVAEDVAQRLRSQAEQRRQRHAVHIAGGRSFRGVDVGVGVDPEDADLLLLAAIELRHSGDGAGRQRVIPAQHQRRHALLQRFQHRLGGAVAGFGYLLQVAGVVAARGLGLGDLHADIAAIGDPVAEGFQARLEAGDPHGGRPHVHPAAAGAHVQRNTDDANAAGGQALRAARRAGAGVGDFNVRHDVLL